jgi:hypothetical protein
MAANPNPTVTHEISHDYHAEANVLHGHLKLPLKQEIHQQAPVLLKDRRGGHFFQRAEHYSLEGLISFKSGYSHVSGNRSLKNHGWVTLATSVLEGLNVLDVITADRMVAQVSTEHPLENGHVPHVTFLGTQFENLRVGGYKVDVELDLGICGDRPKGDIPYTEDPGFLDRIGRQCSSIADAPGLPRALRAEYDEELQQIAEIRSGNGSGKGDGNPPKLGCTLVKSISKIPIATSYGNVLEIPGFGTVSLAVVEVGALAPVGTTREKVGNYFNLTMLKMKMGCIGDGTVSAASAAANGRTYP